MNIPSAISPSVWHSCIFNKVTPIQKITNFHFVAVWSKYDKMRIFKHEIICLHMTPNLDAKKPAMNAKLTQEAGLFPCLFSLQAYCIFSISTNYHYLWSKATMNLWGMDGLFQQSTQRSTGRSIDQNISFQYNCSSKCINAPKCNYSRYWSSHSGASKQHEELKARTVIQ